MNSIIIIILSARHVLKQKMDRIYIIAKYYPNIEQKLYFKFTKRLSNLFRVKDINPF